MNPKRYSQIERALQILDKSGTSTLLKEDQYLLFLFKKTERVVAALYIVTGLFSDEEPIKWTIRESGTLLLKHTLSFRERAVVHSKEHLSDMIAELAYLLSLLDLAHVIDLLSQMNFSVIKRELEVLSGIIESKGRLSNAPLAQPFFGDSFFGVPKDIFLLAREKTDPRTLQPSSEQQEGSDLMVRSLGEFERLTQAQKGLSQGHISESGNVLYENDAGGAVQNIRSYPSKSKGAGTHSSGNQVKEERKQHILSILEKKENAMIKEFSVVITDCSEKTIQRLLIEMVQSGVLKKEGDRRWSRYSRAGKKGTV